MNYSNYEVGNLTICDLTTGKEIMKLDDIADFSQKALCTNEHPLFNICGSTTMDFDNTYIKAEALETIFGSKLSPTKCTAQFNEILYQKQKRIHKSKRINKKWANRYGYIDVIGTYEADVETGEYNKLTGECNFSFTNYKLIKINGKSV